MSATTTLSSNKCTECGATCEPGPEEICHWCRESIKHVSAERANTRHQIVNSNLSDAVKIQLLR